MIKINELLNKIFSSQEDMTKRVPEAFSNTLKRDDVFKEQFESWKNSPQATSLIEKVAENYKLSYTEGLPNDVVGYHEGQGFKGIYIKNNQLISKEACLYLMDLFMERAETLNYRHYHSMEEQKLKGDHILYRQYHYLKPEINNLEAPYHQEYGNILIEYDMCDDEPQFLKVSLTTYSGFDYLEPRPAAELFRTLLSK